MRSLFIWDLGILDDEIFGLTGFDFVESISNSYSCLIKSKKTYRDRKTAEKKIEKMSIKPLYRLIQNIYTAL